jgi:3-oxoacyl-[acyl-carrier-protein] synthase-3
MRFGGSVAVAAARSWLPVTAHIASDAVSEGRLTADQAAALDIEQVPAGPDAGPELAVWAGRRALAAAGWQPATLDLVIHAWTHYQGQDFWSPAHFVADQLGAGHAEVFGLSQMCNGGMSALAVAATRLVADPGVNRAIVTTGDRFAEAGFDRWRADYGTVYGDGGTAVLLARAGDSEGALRLLSIGAGTAAELELTHRDPTGFAPAARVHREQVDVRATMKLFFADAGLEHFISAAQRGIEEALRRSLDDAGLDPADDRIRALALPRLGRRVLEQTYLPAVERVLEVDRLELGRRTGHLGAGDGAATLADLTEQSLLSAGEIAIVLSGGAGYSWSSLVVQGGVTG